MSTDYKSEDKNPQVMSAKCELKTLCWRLVPDLQKVALRLLWRASGTSWAAAFHPGAAALREWPPAHCSSVTCVT